MTLNDNWRAILTKAWSMRFMALSSLSNGALVVITLAPDLLPKSWRVVASVAVLAIVFNGLAMWSRLVYQKDLNGSNK